MYKEFINESKGKITVTSFLCIPCKYMRMVISHSFTIILKCKMFLTCRNLWLTSPTTSEHFPWKIPLACTCKRNYLFANLQSILVTDLFCCEFIVTFFNSKNKQKIVIHIALSPSNLTKNAAVLFYYWLIVFKISINKFLKFSTSHTTVSFTTGTESNSAIINLTAPKKKK